MANKLDQNVRRCCILTSTYAVGQHNGQAGHEDDDQRPHSHVEDHVTVDVTFLEMCDDLLRRVPVVQTAELGSVCAGLLEVAAHLVPQHGLGRTAGPIRTLGVRDNRHNVSATLLDCRDRFRSCLSIITRLQG